MKTLIIVGSKRRNGNSHTIGKILKKYLTCNNQEVDLEIINNYQFTGCIGCECCRKTNKCCINDGMQELYTKIDEADIMVLISPTYYWNVSSDMKKFIERLYCYQVFDKNNRHIWTSVNEINGKKIGATIAICEHPSEDDIGFTSKGMSMPLHDLGYDVVCNQTYLNKFERGSVDSDPLAIKKTSKCGKELVKAIKNHY